MAQHEDGYCDECGAELREVWMTLDGRETCAECAIAAAKIVVRTASKPEARDDGR